MRPNCILQGNKRAAGDLAKQNPHGQDVYFLKQSFNYSAGMEKTMDLVIGQQQHASTYEAQPLFPDPEDVFRPHSTDDQLFNNKK